MVAGFFDHGFPAKICNTEWRETLSANPDSNEVQKCMQYRKKLLQQNIVEPLEARPDKQDRDCELTA